MDPSASRSARDRVLFHLKTKGPQSATELARRLGVTPMAVRQHLQALAADSLVTFTDERRKVGRPARIWALSPAAARRFPDSHAEVTVEIIEAVRTTFGNDGLDRLLAERSRKLRSSYLQRMPPRGASIEERIAALTELRSEEGYMSEWVREDDGAWVLAENHCPICAAATACRGFCHDELSLFREVLGEDVTVNRTDHIFAGARRCAYRIEPARPASSAPRGAAPQRGEPA